MATCTKDGIVTAGNCFTDPNFGPHSQKAILVYILARMTDSSSGTTYASNPSSLASASNCLRSLTPSQKTAGWIGVLNGGIAEAAGLAFNSAVTTLTKATAAEAIKCLVNYTDEQLDAMMLFMACSMFDIIN